MTNEEAQIDIKQEQALAIVKKYAAGTAAVGLLPTPYFDMVAISAVQLRMLAKLGNVYDLPFSANSGKSILASLVGSYVPTNVAFGIPGSAIKSVPVIGHLMGALTMPAAAYASTYAVGKVFIQHFATGGTFLDFDPDKVRSYYKKEFTQQIENKKGGLVESKQSAEESPSSA